MVMKNFLLNVVKCGLRKISLFSNSCCLVSLYSAIALDGVNDVALATLDWVHWYNYERLHSTNGYVSPIDAENIYYCSLIPSGYAA